MELWLFGLRPLLIGKKTIKDKKEQSQKTWFKDQDQMKEYGANTLLSYNKYLRVPDLINLQDCLSGRSITTNCFHYCPPGYELWFKQILHELDAAVSDACRSRRGRGTDDGARGRNQKLLVNQIHILESMTPINFLGFRIN